jgi:hypothetical protein
MLKRFLKIEMQRKGIGVLLFLFLVLLNTAAMPLYAYSLSEGRTYDQAHDTGSIDWSGPVQYVYLTHKDNATLPPEEGGVFCGSGCAEWVTRIGNGGSAGGMFDRDVTYFETMVGFSPDSNVGTAVLQACSAVSSWYLHNTSGSLPGFVSMYLTVPAGCRSWSLSASGGYVDFRSVDVNYVVPPPTPTRTSTPMPTLTSSPTQTPTTVPTSTFTSTPTATVTFTSTAIQTFTPTATFTDTPTATSTSTHTPTLTSSPTATATSPFTPTMTPSLTPTYTPTSSLTITIASTPINTLLPTSTRIKEPIPTGIFIPRIMNTIPLIASLTATLTPSPTMTHSMPPQMTSTVTKTLISPTPVSVTPTPETPTVPHSLPLWQLVGLVGLFIVITSASVVDPRPAALDRLRDMFNQISNHMSKDEE